MGTVGIIGAGAMGSGIAQVAATAGNKVFLYDTKKEAQDGAEQLIIKMLAKLEEKGKLQESAVSVSERITYATDLDEFEPCELVIEAIVEKLQIKKNVFEEVEAIVSDTCILASNTSSLSIASIAAACKNPQRVMGIHFFNPAPLMPLVEIISAVQTDPELAANMKGTIQSWGKVPVFAKDTPGFIVNRIARPFYGEAIRILEEDLANVPTIDWAMKELGGFKMGPFELMDFIGNDINYEVTATVFKEFFFDPRYKPSFTQKRMVEANRLGRKTGEVINAAESMRSSSNPTPVSGNSESGPKSLFFIISKRELVSTSSFSTISCNRPLPASTLGQGVSNR